MKMKMVIFNISLLFIVGIIFQCGNNSRDNNTMEQGGEQSNEVTNENETIDRVNVENEQENSSYIDYNTMVDGGISPENNPEDFMNEANIIIEKLQEDYPGITLEEIIEVGTQIVAGINYHMILNTRFNEEILKIYAVLYMDLNDNPELTRYETLSE